MKERGLWALHLDREHGGHGLGQVKLADPGPICYGAGGTAPTVTDAVATLGLVARSARNHHRDHHRQLNLPQIVERRDVVEINERVDRTGEVVVGLTEDHARRSITDLVDRGVEAIAVSLLWSFLRPDHEELIAGIVEAEFPEVFLSVSSRRRRRLRGHPHPVRARGHPGRGAARRRIQDGAPTGGALAHGVLDGRTFLSVRRARHHGPRPAEPDVALPFGGAGDRSACVAVELTGSPANLRTQVAFASSGEDCYRDVATQAVLAALPHLPSAEPGILVSNPAPAYTPDDRL